MDPTKVQKFNMLGSGTIFLFFYEFPICKKVEKLKSRAIESSAEIKGKIVQMGHF